jgi:CHASE3 domain sensor protein
MNIFKCDLCKKSFAYDDCFYLLLGKSEILTKYQKQYQICKACCEQLESKLKDDKKEVLYGDSETNNKRC